MLVSLLFAESGQTAGVDPAAKAVNSFGVDLYRQVSTGNGNLCLSPYSISAALAMTLAGADGETRAEMARVLHTGGMKDADAAFAALRTMLAETAAKNIGEESESMTLSIANGLFLAEGHALQPAFLAQVKEFHGAAPEPLDFKGNAVDATKRINEWVAKETRNRVPNLIPAPLGPDTRLVLANAIYLKARWANEFSAGTTEPSPFYIGGGTAAGVPTMRKVATFGYVKRRGYTAVALRYMGGELQFVILLPDKAGGLASLEKQMNAEIWSGCAKLPLVEVDLGLPRFKFEPPTVKLADALRALGMRTAFDFPARSANFDRMSPRKPEDYLAISEVFHKTFITVDEEGTEAAATTALPVTVYSASALNRPKPIRVKVDRPFLYAIQHVPSGVCLFMGRVTDPR